jgi:hypothetical protein
MKSLYFKNILLVDGVEMQDAVGTTSVNFHMILLGKRGDGISLKILMA